MMPDEAKIGELKSKHGDLIAIESRAEAHFIFRKPTRHEYDLWYETRKEKEVSAGRELVQSTLVWPQDFGAFLAELDKEPALLMRPDGALDAIAGLAGIGNDKATPAKKL